MAGARSVASMSAPANTVVTRSGRRSCSSAMTIPGLAFPAAQPQIEFTTIITVPGDLRTSSTSDGDFNSRTPTSVNSARIGAMKCSG